MAQLRQHTGDFADLNARVLVISFSESREYARRWLEETGCPFPLLLDPGRALYRRYGLRHSVVRAWSPRTLWLYLKRIVTGRPLYGIRGDPNQLGGDFIIDCGGTIRLAYRSAESTDRPPPEVLLDVLRGLRAGRQPPGVRKRRFGPSFVVEIAKGGYPPLEACSVRPG